MHQEYAFKMMRLILAIFTEFFIHYTTKCRSDRIGLNNQYQVIVNLMANQYLLTIAKFEPKHQNT